jgi:hypothetical protein
VVEYAPATAITAALVSVWHNSQHQDITLHGAAAAADNDDDDDDATAGS